MDKQDAMREASKMPIHLTDGEPDTGDERIYHTEHPSHADSSPVMDTDLGRDNLLNDLPYADLKDL